jgi:hypothetical protein
MPTFTPFTRGTALGTSFSEVATTVAPAVSTTLNMRVVTLTPEVDVTVQVAIVPNTWQSSDAVTNDMFIQPKDLKIGPTGIQVGIYEDTGIILPVGFKIIAKASAPASLTARAHGIVRS